MTWQSGLPRVATIAQSPCSVTPRNWCGCVAARTASMAICTPPSVPFLKPTGIERPDASSRCTWLSVVRAPMAPHETRSDVNCGEIGSRNSQPAGSPSSARSSRTRVRSDMERNVHKMGRVVQRPRHVTLRPAVNRLELLDRIQKKVLWLGTYMVHHANALRPSTDGLKVGGHQASSSSIVSLLTALYFHALRTDDLVAVKAHAAPAFYAIQF